MGMPGGKTPSLVARGIDYLSRREHSRAELATKLKRFLDESQTYDDIEDALNVLQEKGYLSDGRYAENRVRVRGSRYGNRRLVQELRMNGVDSDTISEAMQEAGDESARALAVWKRKFRELPQDPKERNRQIRFLASRGFSFDIISRILSGGFEEDEDGSCDSGENWPE